MPRVVHLFAAAVLTALPSIALPASAGTQAFAVRAVLPAESLGRAATREMMSEVARIWKHYGVHVEWTPATGAAALPLVVLVRFVDRIDAPGLPLGAVKRLNGRMQRVIYVSRPGIQELLQGVRRDVAGPWYELLFGRMAGRVVAHELGHLLLDSAAHSNQGLMRAQFLRGDVLTTSGAYALTPVERVRLEGRLAGEAAMTTTVAWNVVDADDEEPLLERNRQ